MKPAPIARPILSALPYRADSLDYFHTIASRLPMALLLQSDEPTPSGASSNRVMRGRFDIITAAPEYWVETHHGQQQWHGDRSHAFPLNQTSSFCVLQTLLDAVQKTPVDYSGCLDAGLPFCGGLIGYCSYDLAREYISLPAIPDKGIDVPEMQFGFYAWACIQDHVKQCSWLVFHPECHENTRTGVFDAIGEKWKPHNEKLEPRTSTASESHDRSFRKETLEEEYRQKFEKIQGYIKSGDCYQVNLSQRFIAETDLAAQDIYGIFRHTMPSPYCAFIPVLGREQSSHIISLSPERFISVDKNRQIHSQPIKGTSKRHSDPVIDKKNADDLSSNEKNQSENLMIVDLIRNDLGKVCETGSITVTKLFELQSFSNVHHLVSTIKGSLKAGMNAAHALEACFPGGSITGAPKIRAMEIINELEDSKRSVYCGSIAYFSSHGTMDSNIMIRTALVLDGHVYCWGGGGIVADSVCASEYQESIAKINALMEAINR